MSKLSSVGARILGFNGLSGAASDPRSLPAARLLLCPGNRLTGESSSPNLRRAAAFEMLHAGVGESSIGLELEGLLLAAFLYCGECIVAGTKKVRRVGDAISTSAYPWSPERCGEGEGDNLCFVRLVMADANGLDGDGCMVNDG
jgi:hypothetical protein